MWNSENFDGEFGFCARLNLISVRKAFRALGYSGVAYAGAISESGAIVTVKPTIDLTNPQLQIVWPNQ